MSKATGDWIGYLPKRIGVFRSRFTASGRALDAVWHGSITRLIDAISNMWMQLLFADWSLYWHAEHDSNLSPHPTTLNTKLNSEEWTCVSLWNLIGRSKVLIRQISTQVIRFFSNALNHYVRSHQIVILTFLSFARISWQWLIEQALYISYTHNEGYMHRVNSKTRSYKNIIHTRTRLVRKRERGLGFGWKGGGGGGWCQWHNFIMTVTVRHRLAAYYRRIRARMIITMIT